MDGTIDQDYMDFNQLVTFSLTNISMGQLRYDTTMLGRYRWHSLDRGHCFQGVFLTKNLRFFI